MSSSVCKRIRARMLYCYNISIFITEAEGKSVDPDRRLDPLSKRRGQRSKIWFLRKLASAGLHQLLKQGLLSCKPLPIPAACIECLESSDHHHSNFAWHAVHNYRPPTPSFWCSLRHIYTVKSESKQCTERSGGVNRPS
jgi:hypothetical protein